MLGLTTGIGIMMLVSAINPGVSPDLNLTSTVVDQPVTLEAHVREVFEDTPILAEVARCESQFRQFGTDGKIIRGKVNAHDIGVMQINEGYHAEQAEKLGLDLYTLDGNIAYAKVLYEKEGTKPWKASQPCWGKAGVELAKK
ncbi:MAG: hypothetical protein PHS53_01265 [Candidatus Pacebacteria bacterium]|nr:hypothetical protein [Candidatus Paceibacterota bacterium]MDD5356762.1 hypothetical protein [Candidatus Paceibacterota bacterium]